MELRSISPLVLCSTLALGSCVETPDENVRSVDGDDCVACHSQEFSTAPNHTGNYPQTCFECHTTQNWDAEIDHNRFVSACVTCHRADYESATDPVHVGNRPETCDDCHGSTDDWHANVIDGVHPESKFPIAGGAHRFDCFDCHDAESPLPSTGGANTDCVGCHTGEHNQSRVNDQHREVSGYQFDANMPNFCLECHPNGRN